MNRDYIDYIDYLIDIAQRNDVFYLTSKEFHEFSTKVLESLEKQIPMKPTPYIKTIGICKSCEDSVHRLDNYCPNCGQKLEWSEE